MSLKRKLLLCLISCFILIYPVHAAPLYTAVIGSETVKNPVYKNENDTTMLPLREICELLGYEVEWDTENQSIKVITPTSDVSLTIGKDIYVVESDMVFEISASPELYNGLTYVPTLFFSRFFPVVTSFSDENVILIESIADREKQISGFIVDATMNTMIVKALDENIYHFNTLGADKSSCNALLIDTQVTISYTGDLQQPETVKVLKVVQI